MNSSYENIRIGDIIRMKNISSCFVNKKCDSDICFRQMFERNDNNSHLNEYSDEKSFFVYFNNINGYRDMGEVISPLECLIVLDHFSVEIKNLNDEIMNLHFFYVFSSVKKMSIWILGNRWNDLYFSESIPNLELISSS